MSDVPPAASPFDMDIYLRQIGLFWRETVTWIALNGLRIVIAVAIGAVLVVAMYGVRALALRYCRSPHHVAQWPNVIAGALVKTHVLFMVAVAAKLVAGYAGPPALVTATITFCFTIASALQAAVWVREVVLGVVEHRAHGMDDHSSFGSAVGLIRLLVTIVLFAVATLMILDNLGVNVTGLIAGLGIGGIAIGLAAKGIFDDLFSALSIIFDKPFRVGDSVKWDATSGTVESIGLKTTRVRSVTGEEVVISNTNLLDKELHNLARLDRRRIILTIGVTYQTPPETCAAIPAMVKEIVESHDKCTVVRCGMVGFGDSSLDYELQFDVHSEAFNEVFDARSRVCIAILKAFNAEGIEFAYPTQVTFTAAPDGTMVMPYGHGAEALPPAAGLKK